MNQAQILNACLDVIEYNIMPLTGQMVRTGCKVFGAAILRSDFTPVLAATNHEAFSPLWHGEIYAIKQFWELQNHPAPADCVFLSTHQPCCMCASAIAWSGFPQLYYLFSYEQTGSDFNIPHDQRMIRELFGTSEPAASSSYYQSQGLVSLAQGLPEALGIAAMERINSITAAYQGFSRVYQGGAKNMVLR